MFQTDQSHFRFRFDDGTEVTATFRQDEDVDDDILVDTIFRLRFTVEETGGVAGTEDFRLNRQINGGGYGQVTDTGTLIQTADSADAGVNDGDATTDIITGPDPFAAGEIVSSETPGNADTNSATSIAASGHTQIEFVLQIVGADVNDNDVIDFRMTNTMNQLLDSYGQIATLTVDKPAAGGSLASVNPQRRLLHLIGR